MTKFSLPVLQEKQKTIDTLLDEEEKISFIDNRPIPPNIIKEYVSYTEISTWLECSYKHKLKYIDSIYLDGASEHTEFGQVLHDALETYLSTRTMPDVEELKKQLQEKFSALENSASLKEKDWHNRIEPILKSVPSFLDSNFPGWEYIAAEHELYEDIEFQTRKFKGFIDGVIRVPTGKNGEYIYHIIDWKTTSWGWTLQKKIDKKKILQLALYKFFYTKKFNLDMSKVKCHFVLLKRTAKENPCELVTVSVGPKAIEEATGTVQRMLSSVKKGFFLKTKESCSQCIYNKTEHCT